MKAEPTANQPRVLCYWDMALHALSPREATLLTQIEETLLTQISASTDTETRQRWAFHILGRLHGTSDTPPFLYAAWQRSSPMRNQEVSERVGSAQSDVVLYSIYPEDELYITATADSMVHTAPMESGRYLFLGADVFSNDDVPPVKAINLINAYSRRQQGDGVRIFSLDGFSNFFIARLVVFGGAVWLLKELHTNGEYSSHVVGIEVWRNRSWNVYHKDKYSPVLFRKTDETIEQMVSDKDMFSVRPEDRQRLLYEIFRVLPLWGTAGGAEDKSVLSPMMSDSQAVPLFVLPAEDLFVTSMYYSMFSRIHNRKGDPYGYLYLCGSPRQVIDGASIALAKGEFVGGSRDNQEHTINKYQATLRTLTQFDFQQ